MPEHPRHPPRDCPVCGDALALTRLSCRSCGTELSGEFDQCEFCALTSDERDLLRVFLASRGNMKELERHLGVSYPTARARYDGLLAKLGIERTGGDAEAEAEPAGAAGSEPPANLDLLEKLARGEIDVDEALGKL
ncbi:MAG: DUF2089 domain-containing protein [Actinobacteria bacterium]|nr:DUF2089 domain-containing protein [Actinomycetota bacterium]MBV9666054.1 DUF2089 domain-containing protein [Actinomycetota bacterium]MBV9933851.1 DUF2089 domain-containing protein [Actinomycetota bacterium]